MNTKIIALLSLLISSAAFATPVPTAYPKEALLLEGIATRLSVNFQDAGTLDAANCGNNKSFPVKANLKILVSNNADNTSEAYVVTDIACAITDIDQINNPEYTPDALAITAKSVTFNHTAVFVIRKTDSRVIQNQNELPLNVLSSY